MVSALASRLRTAGSFLRGILPGSKPLPVPFPQNSRRGGWKERGGKREKKKEKRERRGEGREEREGRKKVWQEGKKGGRGRAGVLRED